MQEGIKAYKWVGVGENMRGVEGQKGAREEECM